MKIDNQAMARSENKRAFYKFTHKTYLGIEGSDNLCIFLAMQVVISRGTLFIIFKKY